MYGIRKLSLFTALAGMLAVLPAERAGAVTLEGILLGAKVCTAIVDLVRKLCSDTAPDYGLWVTATERTFNLEYKADGFSQLGDETHNFGDTIKGQFSDGTSRDLWRYTLSIVEDGLDSTDDSVTVGGSLTHVVDPHPKLPFDENGGGETWTFANLAVSVKGKKSDVASKAVPHGLMHKDADTATLSILTSDDTDINSYNFVLRGVHPVPIPQSRVLLGLSLALIGARRRGRNPQAPCSCP